MTDNKLIIPINIPGKNIELHIFGETSRKTMIEKKDAVENGEALFQIMEGCFYEYKITDDYSLVPTEVISQSKVNISSGRIFPNIYVGTLTIEVLDPKKIKCGEFNLEVQSSKTTYREDYRHMLEEITEKNVDLLMQHSSPVAQFFEVDFNADARTLYQRFAFIKSILDSDEFNDSVHRIIFAPVTRWMEAENVKAIRGVKRFNSSILRQLSNSSNRINLPSEHPLKSTLQSIPTKINVTNKIETVDTVENRFVKYALVSFQSLCIDFKTNLKGNFRINNEASVLIDKLEHFLNHSVFKDISLPTILTLNSPVLQRKEGYREILRAWLMFDLAAKLIWHGGDDVYQGNKRDVAILYEYWLFFKLLDLIKDVFKIESKSLEALIKQTDDGLGLQLKQGIHIPVIGVYNSGTRKLNIEFSYNKTFNGDTSYPMSGSWTKSMRPDYTLSIWPYGINSENAERDELIAHIHFDAKYKVENILGIVGTDDDFENEKVDQRKGTYKRVDLLKMHSYKDAIRRTAGSYILYPGTDATYTKIGFHELIPGLGAFAIRPSKSEGGTEHLRKFLNDVVSHFMNRASQREKISLRTYETYKNRVTNEMNVALPETLGLNRNLLPDEIFVLIAYYKRGTWDWIKKSGLYNARAEDARGSLRLGPGEAGAKYLLLHTENETTTNRLLKITETGPRVFSKQTLIDKKYPSEPSQNYYLVYKVEEVRDKEFANHSWDIKALVGYESGRGSALPFSVTLTELMKVLVR